MAFDAVFLRIVAVPTRPIDIASQNLFDIMNTTRAMRRVKPDPLPDEMIVKILQALERRMAAIFRRGIS